MWFLLKSFGQVGLAISAAFTPDGCITQSGQVCEGNDALHCVEAYQEAVICKGSDIVTREIEEADRRNLNGGCDRAGYTCSGATLLFCVQRSSTTIVCTSCGKHCTHCGPITTYWYEPASSSLCTEGDIPCKNGACTTASSACGKPGAINMALAGITYAGIAPKLGNSSSFSLPLLTNRVGDGPIISPSAFFFGYKTWAALAATDLTTRVVSIAQDFIAPWQILAQLSDNPQYQAAFASFLASSGVLDYQFRYLTLAYLPACMNDAPEAIECYLNCAKFLFLANDFFKQCQTNTGLGTCNPGLISDVCEDKCASYQPSAPNYGKVKLYFDPRYAFPNGTREYFNVVD